MCNTAHSKINLQLKEPTVVVQLGPTYELTYFLLWAVSCMPLPTGSHMDLSWHLSFTPLKDNDQLLEMQPPKVNTHLPLTQTTHPDHSLQK